MAKAKNYNNYAELVGNVSKIRQSSDNKRGEMRFTLGVHHSYTKKDGTKATETQFINVLVAANRRYAKQDVVTVGKFLRVIGHLENNAFLSKDGNWVGGIEINADKIVELKKREDGAIENTETGEVENIEDEAIEVDNA